MDARAAGNWKQAASLKRKTGTGFPKISYTNLFWLFMLGSVAGFVLEGLWCILMEGHWENHSATVWGPFCIIYGIGAAAVSLLSILLKGRVLPSGFSPFQPQALRRSISQAFSRSFASARCPGITADIF